jgi:hypothetical protein
MFFLRVKKNKNRKQKTQFLPKSAVMLSNQYKTNGVKKMRQKKKSAAK